MVKAELHSQSRVGVRATHAVPGHFEEGHLSRRRDPAGFGDASRAAHVVWMRVRDEDPRDARAGTVVAQRGLQQAQVAGHAGVARVDERALGAGAHDIRVGAWAGEEARVQAADDNDTWRETLHIGQAHPVHGAGHGIRGGCK